jgi:hypothetical protein
MTRDEFLDTAVSQSLKKYRSISPWPYMAEFVPGTMLDFESYNSFDVLSFELMAISARKKYGFTDESSKD